MTANLHVDDRTRGVLPVRKHLRPAATDAAFPALFERDDEGFLFVSAVDFSEAGAVPIGGEA